MIEVFGAQAPKAILKGVIREIRPVWCLEELKVPYKINVIDPMKKENKTPEYLKIHPFGKIPAMRDGDFTMFESGAICVYLGDKFGKLIPKAGTFERAQFDQWNFFSVSSVEPHATRVFASDFFLEKNEVTAEIRKSALGILQSLLEPLDPLLSQRPYILGDDFSIADIILTTTLNIVNKSDVLKSYPAIQSYVDKNISREAYKKAFEKNGNI